MAVLCSGFFSFFLMAAKFKQESKLLSVILGLTGFCWFFGGLFILAGFNRKRIFLLKLQCPNCGAALIGPSGRQAVTTLHCDNCGNKILEEDRDSERLAPKI